MTQLLISELEGSLSVLRRAKTIELVTDAGIIKFHGQGIEGLRESLIALFEANLKEAKK
jgi:hypothetical protein